MEDKIDPNVDINHSQEQLLRPSNIRYEIFFSPHGNTGDFRGLFRLIGNADIYIPEVQQNIFSQL